MIGEKAAGDDQGGPRLSRSRILAVTGQDLQRVGALYLTSEKANTAVMSGANSTDEAIKLGLEICKLDA